MSDSFSSCSDSLPVADAEPGIQRTNVLGVGVSVLNMPAAVDVLIAARNAVQTGYVCVTGVHGVIESQRDPDLKQIHNRSFLTVPDGMPTVWMGREQGFTKMGRVYGPDLMLRLMEATTSVDDCSMMDDEGCGQKTEVGKRKTEVRDQEPGNRHQVTGKKNEGFGSGSHGTTTNCDSSYLYPSQDETGGLDLGHAPSTMSHQRSTAQRQLTHFLYGATEEMLERLKQNLEQRFPGARIVGTYAPPFRPLNEEEEAELSALVAECKPDFFWVGLSTPKQERFMAAHADNPDFGIMLGVGAAFPIHAGLQKDAPEWIKNSGLQWFHRLCQEPRRLWRRYLDIVPTFLWLAFLQVMGVRKYSLGE